MNNVVVSIVMSNYNGSEKINNTIKSVLGQSFKNFEFIIIDDGSSDDSKVKVDQFNDNRIIFIVNENNLGLTKNLIKGVEEAKGRYIARIDVGDYWHLEKLHKQVDFLEKNKEYVICGTQVNYFDKNGIVDKSWFSIDDKSIRKRFISNKGIFEHSSILFRNKIINYRKQFRYAQDQDLYLRISFLGKLYCLDETLTFSEINLEGITLNKKYLQRQFQKHAFKLYTQRLIDTTDDIDSLKIEELKIRDTKVDKFFNKLSMFFYTKYVFNRTKKKAIYFWLAPLFISLLLYPPYMVDYLNKLKGVIEK